MIKVAITGTMGSGKSFCSKQFEKLGVPVFNSDEENRRMQCTNQELKAQIVAGFGSACLVDGRLDSVVIRKLIFGDGLEQQENLKKITNISKPYVISAFQSFCESHSDALYVLAESAILFEAGLDSIFDSIIYVVADEKLRIAATLLRDGISEEEYHQRMRNQMSDEFKRSKSTYIISNDYTQAVIEQIKIIDNKIKNVRS